MNADQKEDSLTGKKLVTVFHSLNPIICPSKQQWGIQQDIFLSSLGSYRPHSNTEDLFFLHHRRYRRIRDHGTAVHLSGSPAINGGGGRTQKP